MFTFAQFDYLHSLWDGRPENTNVCSSCGLCCPTEKALFPGEYGYLVHKTGQKNAAWFSNGCLCMEAGNTVKAVICKLYPLTIRADIKSFILDEGFDAAYTNKCSELKFNIKTLRPFLSYLFRDVDNRLFWALNYNFSDVSAMVMERFKLHGLPITSREADLRAMFILLHQSYDKHDKMFEDVLSLNKKA